jgi:AAA15 family ATPase/GTPase
MPGDQRPPNGEETLSFGPVAEAIMKSVRIKELRLRHYRAFSDARLLLDDITFLVGRNGAGKSTLMDGLSFLSEAVTDSLSNVGRLLRSNALWTEALPSITGSELCFFDPAFSM